MLVPVTIAKKMFEINRVNTESVVALDTNWGQNFSCKSEVNLT